MWILTACTAPAAPAATAVSTPLPPTATPTPVPSMTAMATLTSTFIPSSTATEPPTPTTELTPQVNPGMNVYCRKGPGTNYFAITFLQAGTNYLLLGQNGLNTWWVVQFSGNITCWIGDPTAVLVGPVWDVPILTYPPLPGQPAGFKGTITCHSAQNILVVSLYWSPQSAATTGFRLYRNGALIKTLGANAGGFTDNAPPFSVNLEYVLQAFNEYGVSDRATVSFPPCG